MFKSCLPDQSGRLSGPPAMGGLCFWKIRGKCDLPLNIISTPLDFAPLSRASGVPAIPELARHSVVAGASPAAFDAEAMAPIATPPGCIAQCHVTHGLCRPVKGLNG